MFFLDDPNWAQKILPYLPEQYKKIYISLLYTFCPQAVRKCGHIRYYENNGYVWNFPFVMTGEAVKSFDYDGFDEWMLYVEQSMIADYGLTTVMFEN